ncbi:MAG: 50S ribosomal protein L30e [Candidatus Diapherotrites archaeon]|nr:50S ribosomal protein L30e [Candidatus Diapherotrites archaeon]
MAKIDANKEIRRAVDTGKVEFGFKQSEKNILKGNAELIILSSNVQKRIKEKIKQQCEIAKIPFFEFSGTSVELGSICGKPFIISCLCIRKQGKSKVLDLPKNKQ